MSTQSMRRQSRHAAILMLAIAPSYGLFSQALHAATETWTGTVSENWADSGNWAGTHPVPVAGDSLLFSASGTTITANNLTLNPTPIAGITFDASAPAYTANGPSGVLLTGNVAANSNGITNSSAADQTVNLNLTLDWGRYTIGSTTAANIVLNGSVTLSTGATVAFGGTGTGLVNPATLQVDANTGLIAGLNGTAVVTNPASGRFIGLATVSGSAVTQYTYNGAADQVNSSGGTIVSNVNSNVQLNATASAATSFSFTDTTIYLNTLSNVNGTAGATGTDFAANVTLAAGQTLVMGKMGGIYGTEGGVTNGTSNSNYTNISGAGAVSAGGNTAGAGTLVLGINGGTTNNQLGINNTGGIIDNPLGGAVTIIKTGTGSAVIRSNSSYTGGTYIDQGYLQGNAATAFGNGPVYIASGTTAFPNAGTTTFPNDFVMSNGVGYSANTGALKVSSNGDIFSGATNGIALTLTGGPVLASPGNRMSMSSNNSLTTITGQITGTGTLEAYSLASGLIPSLSINNTSANPNNWTGGLLIDGATNDSMAVKIGAANQMNNNTVSLLQAGTGIARFDLNGFSDSIGGLNSSVTATTPANNIVTNGGTAASTLTIGANNAAGNFGGVITDGGAAAANTLAIVKTGSGAQTLTGANTYTGGTSINAGALYVNTPTVSGTGTGTVTLNGGTLGGLGVISGAVVAGTGAHSINPGATGAASVGTLTVGGLTTAANTTLSFDLGSPDAGAAGSGTLPNGTSDLLAVAGSATLGGGALAITSQVSTGNVSLGYYKVMSYSGTLTGTTANITLPAVANNIAYTLDSTRDPGFIDVHRGFVGDATDDGTVDLNDLNVVLNNLGVATNSWNRGNFDGAATIDLNDLNAVLNHLGTSIPSGANVVAFAEALVEAGTLSPNAVPEPGCLSLMGMGAAALLARRSRRPNGTA